MRQSNCDEDAAETAMQNYLRKLLGVANLQVAAHYNEARADGTLRPARLRAHRRHPGPVVLPHPDRGHPGRGQLERRGSRSTSTSRREHLLPVIWDQRLYLIWPVFKQISEKQSDHRPSRPAAADNPRPGAAEVLVGGVRHEPAQRGPVAAEADPAPRSCTGTPPTHRWRSPSTAASTHAASAVGL